MDPDVTVRVLSKSHKDEQAVYTFVTEIIAASSPKYTSNSIMKIRVITISNLLAFRYLQNIPHFMRGIVLKLLEF